MIKEKRILFMGTPNIAVPYLEALIKNKYNIVGVYSQPSRPKDRGMKVQPSPISIFAKKFNIPVFTPINLNDDEEYKKYMDLNIDLTIVMGYGILLPKKFLEHNFFGCINIHLSMLPRWRGASPIENSLIAGDKETGVTIFKLVKAIDAGPILDSNNLFIKDSMSKGDLQEKLNEMGINLLIDLLPKYLNNKIALKEQDITKVTYASKIKSNDAHLNFLEKANTVKNKIRAFSPNPGAWFKFKNERIKILSCEVVDKKGKPGTILTKNLLIACSEKSIQPILVQREGKKIMKIDNFVRGFSFSINQQI